MYKPLIVLASLLACAVPAVSQGYSFDDASDEIITYVYYPKYIGMIDGLVDGIVYLNSDLYSNSAENNRGGYSGQNGGFGDRGGYGGDRGYDNQGGYGGYGGYGGFRGGY